MGILGRGGEGGKNRDNYNSIINKIYLKKRESSLGLNHGGGIGQVELDETEAIPVDTSPDLE